MVVVCIHTENNLFAQICSRENILKAHHNAKRLKSHYHQVQTVEKDIANSEDGFGPMLASLQESLINHTYTVSPYKEQTRVERGKLRKLYKLPYFPDRIVQWAILQVIEPYILKSLIKRTYSAIPGRGVHQALEDIKKTLYNDVENCLYCIKIDIKHYYQSINHEILKDKLRCIFKDKDLLWLLDLIIDSVETADEEDLERLHQLKEIDEDVLTKFIKGRNETPEERYERYINSRIGVPIGNYFSQYAGNFYLSSLDHYILEQLHAKHYYRYMDDLVILCPTKEEAHYMLDKVRDYCERKLLIKFKSNYQIFPTYVRGIDFLGFRIFRDYVLLRKSSCKSFKRRMRAIAEHGKKHPISYKDYCSYNSYLGWLKPCDSDRLKTKYLTDVFPYIMEYECTHNLHSKRRKAYGELWVNTIQRSSTGEESGRI